MAFEFRAEAFNIFNHPQWTGVNNTSCGLEYNSGASDCINGDDVGDAPNGFLHPSGVHEPRIGEFGLKFIF